MCGAKELCQNTNHFYIIATAYNGIRPLNYCLWELTRGNYIMLNCNGGPKSTYYDCS